MATCNYLWNAEKREQINELITQIQNDKDLSNACTITINTNELLTLKIALEYINDNFEDAIHRHMGSIGLGEMGMHFSDVSYPFVPDKWQVTRLLRQLSPEE